jgi:hypothetical protein
MRSKDLAEFGNMEKGRNLLSEENKWEGEKKELKEWKNK